MRKTRSTRRKSNAKRRNRSQEQLLRDAQRKREMRASLTPEQLAIIRAKDAQYKREKRAQQKQQLENQDRRIPHYIKSKRKQLKGLDLYESRERAAKRKREYRAALTPEQREEIRSKDAQRKREMRIRDSVATSSEQPIATKSKRTTLQKSQQSMAKRKVAARKKQN